MNNILVISLERAKERRQKMQDQLLDLQIDGAIFDAVDWKSLEEMDLNKKIWLPGGYRYGEVMRPSEIACTMSHIKALQYAQLKSWPFVIILEDDVVLAEDFKERIRFLLKILPNDWEHVYLSGIPRLPFGYFPNLSFKHIEPSPFVECTFSMIVRKEAYEKVIEYLWAFRTTVDDSYAAMISEGKLKSYIYYPFVTYCDDDYSFIWDQETRRPTGHPSIKYFKNNGKLYY